MWVPLAAVLKLFAIGASAGPPTSGLALLAAHAIFALIVLSGPLALTTHAGSMLNEPIFWMGIALSTLSIGLLLWNRNRRPLVNVLSGSLWCGAGAIGLFIAIVFTI
jgi:hypothetical protein